MATEQRKRGRLVAKTNAAYNAGGEERASTLVKALASMHRYVEGGQAPWCVATSSGVLVAVHMLRAGGRLKIVDTPGPAPLREAE
ncbi:unnamed protein product [Prorocentrum cordatum]|uniref:Uncharacterized protein n=1 Tax=Prorocentrum cordatum TaxID=2364126 RepID=A0ABN9ST88_9DINO|nr:unnamed protein product [Polarella glacialis]